jgi:hypothetical protein
MRETAAQFTGEPLEEGASSRNAVTENTSSDQTRRTQSAPTEEISSQTTEIQQLQQLEALRAIEEAQIQIAAEYAAIQGELDEEQTETDTRETKKQQSDANTAALLFSSPSLVSLVVLFFKENFKLINHIIFKRYDLAPEPSVGEMGTILGFDCLNCLMNCPAILGCFIFLIIIAITSGGAALAISAIGSLFQ